MLSYSNIIAYVKSALKNFTVNASQVSYDDSTSSIGVSNVQDAIEYLVVNGGGGGGGHIIQDEGVSLPQRDILNFVGDAVTVTDDTATNKTVVTITGTGGGSGLAETFSTLIVNRYFEEITVEKDTFPIRYTLVNGEPYVDVWVNGILLSPTEYVGNDGTSITLNNPLAVTDPVQEIRIIAGFDTAGVAGARGLSSSYYAEEITTIKDTFPSSYSIIGGVPQVHVWLNGIKLSQVEFNATDGTNVILNEVVDGTTSTKYIEIIGYTIYVTSSGVRTTYKYIATPSQTTFNAVYVSKDYIDFFFEGHKLGDSEYSATDGTSVDLTDPAIGGEIIEIVVYNEFYNSGITVYNTDSASRSIAMSIIFGGG